MGVYVGKEPCYRGRGQTDMIPRNILKDLSVFYLQKCFYTNLINSKNREFDCVMKLYPLRNNTATNQVSYDYIVNKNFNTK